MHVLLYQEEDEEAEEKEAEEEEIRSYSFVRVAKISLVRLMSVKPTSCTKRGGFVYFRMAIFILSFSFFFSAMKCRSYLLQFLQEDLLLPLCCLR